MTGNEMTGRKLLLPPSSVQKSSCLLP